MSVFLERFVLTVLAALVMGVVVFNPLAFDWQQRVSLGIALILLAYFVGHTVQRTNQAQQPLPTTPSVAAIPNPSPTESLRPHTQAQHAPGVAAQSLPPLESPSHGPFPPFDLGGSLMAEDYFDGFGPIKDRWYPIKKPLDATVDWTDMKRAELVVIVKLAGGLAMLDVRDENDVSAVGGPTGLVGTRPTPSSSSRLTTVPEPTELILPLRRALGIHRYHVVVRASPDQTVDTFWVQSEIDFPRESLGGTDWTGAATGSTIYQPTPGAQHAEIDWGTVRDPTNQIIAQVTFRLYNPKHVTESIRGRGRVRILNVMDNTTTAESDWFPAGQRQGMSPSSRDLPSRSDFALRLDERDPSGRKRYRLEIQTADAELRVAASGTLLRRH